MRYLKVKQNLFLVEQFVNNQAAKAKPSNINNIWIYDRSGSMSGVLEGLARDLIIKAKELPMGDTITLGWFSSHGEYNFMLKGFKITEKKDYKVIEDTINKNKSTIGMTCFSEILADTSTVIKDLSAISNTFALCFFTDGYPTVSPYDREVKAIHAAIDKIGSKIASSLLVGYGDYYNKELMTQMAERMGGALIHSESLPAFNVQLGNFMKDSRENGSKVVVNLESLPASKSGVVFGINGNQISPYAVTGNAIDFAPTRGSKDSVYILTDKAPKGAEEIKLSDEDLKKPTSSESMIRGVYAAAFLLTQKAKSDVALEVLATIGDKDMIDSVNNAFTNAEYGRAESKIQEAMSNPKRRFMQGIKKNYLPPADAFCVLDAVNLLMQDEEAHFFPYHDAFEYKRIGAGAKTKAGFPEFVADVSKAKCALNKLNWNKTMLNLSVLANIPGAIELTGDYKKHGFAKSYPTYVWRNYAIVKDGFLNVQKLPVTLSKESFVTLQQEGVIDTSARYKDSETYVLNLDQIPIINRSIAEGRTSAKDLCTKAYREKQLEGELKALNYLSDQVDPDGKLSLGKGALTADQELYLESQGVGRNGFSPPSEKVPTTDFYMAKEFEIKLKGLSSLPSGKDVQEKMTKGAKLTPSALLLKSGFDVFNTNLKKTSSDKVKLAFLEDEISKRKRELVHVRSDIQATKFSVILGKKWFDEFSSRDQSTITVDGTEFDLVVSETKVEL